MEKLIWFIYGVVILVSGGICLVDYYWEKYVMQPYKELQSEASEGTHHSWKSLIVFILSLTVCIYFIISFANVYANAHTRMYSHTYSLLYKDNRYGVALNEVGYYDYVKLRFKKGLGVKDVLTTLFAKKKPYTVTVEKNTEMQEVDGSDVRVISASNYKRSLNYYLWGDYVFKSPDTVLVSDTEKYVIIYPTDGWKRENSQIMVEKCRIVKEAEGNG